MKLAPKFRNRAAEPPCVGEPCGTGQHRREPLEDGASLLRHLPARGLAARWPRPGGMMNPSGKRQKKGIGNGKRGCSTRMRFNDTVLMEVVLAQRQTREPLAAEKRLVGSSGAVSMSRQG